jgi:glycosyltransferase involved in cell wall biosynthesis
MKILVVTSVFPNSKQQTLGLFVKERMFRIGRHCELKVIAPVPWFPLVRHVKKGYRPKVPYLEIQEGIEVYHPRFFNIPRYFKFLDGFFFFLSSLITAWKIRKDYKFEIIDSHFVYPDGFGSLLLGRLFKRPVTITVRGTIRKLLRYSLIKMQIVSALRNCEKIFTVCTDLKQAVTDLGIPGKKVVVIPNGVAIEKFRPVNKMEMRRTLGLPLNKKIIISVGALVERKGFHRIISVLPEIRKTNPEVFYVLIGGPSVEGDNERELRKLASKLRVEDMTFLAGPKLHEELHKWYSAADLFCLATSNEGWPNVFLEAMACGLPVVTSRVGGNEEIIVSEDYGLFFELDCEERMIAVILEALSKEWNREKIISYAISNNWDEKVGSLLTEFCQLTNVNSNCLSEHVVP